MKIININSNVDNIEKVITFTYEYLKKRKCAKKDILSALLTLEEVLALQINNSEDEITITVSKGLNGAYIKVKGKGNKVDIEDIRKNIFSTDGLDDEAKSVISKLVERLTGNALSYKRVNDLNIFEIKVSENSLRSFYITICALLSGLIFGFLGKLLLPSSILEILSNNFFGQIYNLFLTSLKMVVGPLVFFSIASSIANLKDIKTFGRIAMKIVGLYFLTSLFAIGVGFVSSYIFPVGNPSLQSAILSSGNEVVGEIQTTSIIDTLINIIPKNIVDPFRNGDMLQIIFLGIIIGVATSAIGDDNLFEKCINDANKVFSKIVESIVKLMPIAIFSSMVNIALNLNLSEIASAAVLIPAVYIGLALMLVVYSLLLIFVGKINPIEFFKKSSEMLFTAVSTSSSSATMPITMKTCHEKFHISPKLYSFSIPLGATINMDGGCVQHVVTAFFIARIFNVSFSSSLIMLMIITIMTLALGAPGIPGGGIVTIAIMCAAIGLPTSSIAIIIGIFPFLDIGITCINVTGDAVVTLLVANSEGLIKESI